MTVFLHVQMGTSFSPSLYYSAVRVRAKPDGPRTNQSPRLVQRLHEFSVTETILRLVEDEAKKAGAARVDEVTVVIGELTGFSGDSIEFYFQRLSEGSVAAAATLLVETRQARASCSACRKSFRPLHPLSTCPACGSADFEVDQGHEFYLDNIQVS